MITIRYNNKFKEFLGEGFLSEVMLGERLFDLSILNAQVVKHEEGYFFDFQKPEGKLSPDLTDTTGNEAFYNKIQVVDYIETDIDIRATLIQSIKYSLILASKLSSISNQEFSVLLSFDGEFESVTFYGDREGENYIDEDLEKMFFPTLLIKVESSYLTTA